MQYKRTVLSLMVCFWLAGTLQAVQQRYEYNSPKGLKTRVLIQPSMEFVHAQLLIFHKGKYTNPAAPALMMLGLFNREANNGSSDLLNSLKKLGSDYSVEITAEYISIKVNFLPRKLRSYFKFVKELFNYKLYANIKINRESFYYNKREREAQRVFKRSRDDYWRIFFKSRNWKRDIANQIGYNKLFPNSKIGNFLVTADSLRESDLTLLRRFYQRVFRFPNTLLLMKGKVRSVDVRFQINRELASFKQQEPEMKAKEELNFATKDEIVVFNVNTLETPKLFWFEAVEPVTDPNSMHRLAINNVLFGFPLGRICRSENKIDINALENIQSEVNNHENVSVICNSIELNYHQVEPFMKLVRREKKRLTIKRIERKEFRNTITYIAGKLKVNTRHFENDLGPEILEVFNPASSPTTNIAKPLTGTPQLTLTSLNRRLAGLKKSNGTRGEIIVIVGNYNILRRYLGSITPTVFNYTTK